MAGQQLMVLLWSYFSQTAAKFGKAAPLTEQKLPVTYTAQPLAKGISVKEFQGGQILSQGTVVLLKIGNASCELSLIRLSNQ